MALTANREVNRFVDQELRTLPVKAGALVYKGALVGLSGGYARGLVAGDAFAGIAYESADNSAGQDGDRLLKVFTQGDFEHGLVSADREHNGAAVFASDDATLTYVSTDNSLVGRQVDTCGADKIVLRLRTWMES